MFYVLPEEALILQRASNVLTLMEDRFRAASYPAGILEQVEQDESYVDKQRTIRESHRQARENAQLVAGADGASAGLFRLMVWASSYGCEVAEQTVEHWHQRDWTGPEFSIKRGGVSDHG